jgi:hypothetical protein
VKGKMKPSQVREYLTVIPRFASGVCFTGGEPMLYYREILGLLPLAKKQGLKVSLVTGAGWVRREKGARIRMRALADAGLGQICISWDRYHEEFSQPDRALLLARVAVECGLGVSARVVASSDAEKEKYHAMFDGLPVNLQAQAPVKLGRAKSLPSGDFQFSPQPPEGVCTVVLTPVIEADGTVYACCGPSYYCGKASILRLGNTNEEPLEEIFQRAASDPVFEAILNLGPHGLYQLLKDHPIGRERFKTRPFYTGICELCLDITNSPEFVQAIRERLLDADAQRFLVAARLWMKTKLLPEFRRSQSFRKPTEAEAPRI